jgi:AcrR family transcriptional regulator
MSPRSASVNEELRRRSRERLLYAAVELVAERGYDATTLADIADRAGSARGLVSYYFPSKRQLLQSAVHRLMHRTLEEGLERAPTTDDGHERMARAIDAVLGLTRDHPVLMRQHMAGILQAEGFVQCPEQQRLAQLLRETVVRNGSDRPDQDYPMLRALLMGAVYAALVPGAPMPLPVLRAELFRRYGLAWEQGMPPETDASAGAHGAHGKDLSRFFATEDRDGARGEPTGQPGRTERTGRPGRPEHGRPSPEGTRGGARLEP